MEDRIKPFLQHKGELLGVQITMESEMKATGITKWR